MNVISDQTAELFKDRNIIKHDQYLLFQHISSKVIHFKGVSKCTIVKKIIKKYIFIAIVFTKMVFIALYVALPVNCIMWKAL